MSNKRTLIALSAALALGILGAATAAQAGTDNGSTGGGYVVPGSLDGVNPAYHPGIFRNPATAKAYGFASSVEHGRTVWHTQNRG